MGSVVSRSLIKLIKTHPAVGWVHADLLPDQSVAEEMLRLRKQIEELENSLDTSPKGTEHLSQGDDSIELSFSFNVYESPDTYRSMAKYGYKFNATWNDIFAVISPLLIDEASDRILKNSLDNFVQDKNLSSLQKESTLKNLSLRNFALEDDDFNTIKVQLLALKLMSKSTKKKTRIVSDRNAYWMLTPYGEPVMMSLRAIKKDL